MPEKKRQKKWTSVMANPFVKGLYVLMLKCFDLTVS